MNQNRKCFIFSLIIFLFVGISQPTFAQNNSSQPKVLKGEASWYGSRYHGRKTSSGERYNKNDMTAAHKTLPFGTKVKVTNLENNQWVILRINDRGPFVGDRIIDVSEAAARKLDFHSQGIGNVKVEVLDSKAELAAAIGFSFDVPSFAKNELNSGIDTGMLLSQR
ncbi:septal ring lytic transglycosylase RlpA family protein [Pontibacter anaerobius]|uniref:Probable endolytic peptidoglycan transglycosylase RlpA n=1 Tax=Pontibacter anaerobius TaxID=2993940 RepID=A0ABT3RGD6_9BACT|nr:septal ring lytic transglycosylase RlpA family protein [Pontibacter anaerobius]MCX2740682.1 septal ring lytic transglycosylase RlpA family protein [Pontibacter anaerobius]